MVPSLFTEKHDDFYQQASSIVGLSVPFQVQNGGKDYPMLRAVGYRVSPKSGPPLSGPPLSVWVGSYPKVTSQTASCYDH